MKKFYLILFLGITLNLTVLSTFDFTRSLKSENGFVGKAVKTGTETLSGEYKNEFDRQLLIDAINFGIYLNAFRIEIFLPKNSYFFNLSIDYSEKTSSCTYKNYSKRISGLFSGEPSVFIADIKYNPLGYKDSKSYFFTFKESKNKGPYILYEYKYQGNRLLFFRKSPV